MMAEEPGGSPSPTFLSSSSLKPLSRILPQTPPPAPPTIAPAMMLGGKIRPTRPPATAPRLAQALPLGSLVSLKVTLPSVSCTTTAASTSLIEPPLSIVLSWLSDSVASYSLPNVATTTTKVLLSVMCTTSTGRGDARRGRSVPRHPRKMNWFHGRRPGQIRRNLTGSHASSARRRQSRAPAPRIASDHARAGAGCRRVDRDRRLRREQGGGISWPGQGETGLRDWSGPECEGRAARPGRPPGGVEERRLPRRARLLRRQAGQRLPRPASPQRAQVSGDHRAYGGR